MTGPASAHQDRPTGTATDPDTWTGTGDAAGDRRQRGIATYARILAVPEQDLPAALAARVGQVFADEAFQTVGGAAWSHPALTARDRSIALITALTAQGVSGDRLLTHLRLAQKHGLDADALTALMTLLAPCLGLPRASLAMETVHLLTDPAAP